MKTLKKNIFKEVIRKKKYIYMELYIKILKSIIHNKSVSPRIRSYCYYKITLKKIDMKKNSKICLMSGRYRGTSSFLNISRHRVKYLNSKSLISNLSIRSW